MTHSYQQAFPQQLPFQLQPAHMSSSVSGDAPGMTLREYYAGQVIAGLAAQYYQLIDADKTIAKLAVAIADALCEELSK